MDACKVQNHLTQSNTSKTHCPKFFLICYMFSNFFNQSHVLKLYPQTHTGEDSFKCDQGSESFQLTRWLKMPPPNQYGWETFLMSTVSKVSQLVKCSQTSSPNVQNLLDSWPGDPRIRFKIHTGERPFKYLRCPRSFSRSSDSKRYLHTHVRERPFVCLRCPDFLRE